MTPALRVLAPGLLTTVQDLGRPGYQALGIPVGGALDPLGLRAANALVGNAPDAGALEIAYLGPTLQVEADDVRLSFAGAEASIEILEDVGAASRTRIETMRSVGLRRGEVLRIGSLTGGAVLYLAVEGGFDIAPVFGSVATFLRGGFGGWQGRALVAGDRLPLARPASNGGEDCRIEGLELAPPAQVRIIPGPQSDCFSPQTMADFLAATYTIGAGSDRTGMRLAGPRLRHVGGFDIASDGIAPGSIQVPGSGEPIVLLADRQTTGGYPKIATVVSADLPVVGRRRPGDAIRFAAVSIDAAEDLAAEAERRFAALAASLEPVPADAGIDLGSLYAGNLISGVVSGRE